MNGSSHCLYLSVRLPRLQQCSCSLPAGISQCQTGGRGFGANVDSATDCVILLGVIPSVVLEIRQLTLLACGRYIHLY